MTNADAQKEILLPGKDGKPMEIPFEGSLELLAWGDLGYYAWQQKRAKYKKTNDEE